jgi:hypothetical protein
MPTCELNYIYDSGCTRHISPYCKDFTSFAKISPKVFQAANKQSFSATGKGEIIINIPKDADFSRLQLTQVLYSPEVGYTLVSIGKLDNKGFSATFLGRKCCIHGPDGEQVGEIPKCKGLDKVQHDEREEANVVEDTLTLDSLQPRLGHISPKAA